MIAVCKKYYLHVDVVVNELKSTSTYKEVNDECENVRCLDTYTIRKYGSTFYMYIGIAIVI